MKTELRPESIRAAVSCVFPAFVRFIWYAKVTTMDIPSLTLTEVLSNEQDWPSTCSAINLLSEVEIIFGRDIPTQEVFLVYGRKRLRELFQEGRDDSDVDVLMIDIARQTDELNQLLALVQIAKQSYDYVEAA